MLPSDDWDISHLTVSRSSKWCVLCCPTSDTCHGCVRKSVGVYMADNQVLGVVLTTQAQNWVPAQFLILVTLQFIRDSHLPCTRLLHATRTHTPQRGPRGSASVAAQTAPFPVPAGDLALLERGRGAEGPSLRSKAENQSAHPHAGRRDGRREETKPEERGMKRQGDRKDTGWSWRSAGPHPAESQGAAETPAAGEKAERTCVHHSSN